MGHFTQTSSWVVRSNVDCFALNYLHSRLLIYLSGSLHPGKVNAIIQHNNCNSDNNDERGPVHHLGLTISGYSGEKAAMPLLRTVSALLVALVFCSICAVSFHHHVDPGACSACVFCKFSDDLSSGKKIEPLKLAAPGFIRLAFVYEGIEPFDSVPVFSVKFRGPPIS